MKPHGEKEFLERIDIQELSGCWLWLGKKNYKGYGLFKDSKAHRFSYESFYQKIPCGLVLDHVCRIRHCVNPTHLRLSTHKDNILSGEGIAAKNSMKTECKNGHELNESNIYRYHGGRFCRICHNISCEKYRRTN